MKKAFIGRGGFKLSDSGGRTVIDKMYDLENNGDAEFSGTDRPEWYDGMVCVEAERENLWQDFFSGNIINADLADSLSIFPGSPAYEGKHLDSTTLLLASGISPIDGPRVLSFFVEMDDGSAPVPSASASGGDFRIVIENSSPSSVHVAHWAGNIYRVWGVKHTEGSGINSGVYKYSGNSDKTFRFTGFQFEKGSFPTLPIITSGSTVTRLAPTVPIEDALPLTGTVAGVVDMVRSNANDYMYRSTSGSIEEGVSMLLIPSTGPVITARIYGQNGGYISTAPLGFSWPINTRRTLAYLQSWDDSSQVVRLLLENGDIHTYSSPNQINDTSHRTIQLGGGGGFSPTSQRYETPWFFGDVIRTGATDAEIKAFFEFLTLGTSMQMTADEMEIV